MRDRQYPKQAQKIAQAALCKETGETGDTQREGAERDRSGGGGEKGKKEEERGRSKRKKQQKKHATVDSKINRK